MSFEEYITAGGQRLRRGYTTGTCAALAAKAAAELLLGGSVPESVSVVTPAGVTVTVCPEEVCLCAGSAGVGAGAGGTGDAAAAAAGAGAAAAGGVDVGAATPGTAGAATPGATATSAQATIVKDAGDDYDITNGAHICARVSLCNQGISIDGGKGVGRVTCPGLDQPVGAAAINSGPRALIRACLENVANEYDYGGGFSVVIEVPEGEELGRKTFNPSLGIEGGISILGTSGIVEPRSLKALQDALKVEIHVRAENTPCPKRLIVVPGNYGQAFLETMGLSPEIPVVSCANFIGFTLDQAAEEGFEQLLLVGHIGKLVKVAGGIMDTHSRMADCRREIFAAHAAAAGANQQTVLALFQCMTTDACLDVIEQAGIKDAVLDRLEGALQYQLDHRAGEHMEVGAVIFSNKSGLLACTPKAKHLVETWKRKEEQ